MTSLSESLFYDKIAQMKARGEAIHDRDTS